MLHFDAYFRLHFSKLKGNNQYLGEIMMSIHITDGWTLQLIWESMIVHANVWGIPRWTEEEHMAKYIIARIIDWKV